ncbi:hypothetical protein PQX77_002652 [Marasmius sp. AFHP31]|nr:hypothetical protein PQX77_002652 [Marasmius sp. AFHP31]
MLVQNTNDSSGTQNNYNSAGPQNVSFVNSFNTAASQSHRNLWDAIAGVGASPTAEQQYERGECLPGTREEVLGLRRMIKEWIRARRKGCPISWLTGAAGVGKTAVAMTLAKACERDGFRLTLIPKSKESSDPPAEIELRRGGGTGRGFRETV